MKTLSLTLFMTVKRLCAASAIGFVLAGAAGSTLAADNMGQPQKQEWMQRAKEMHEKHLQMMAKHLNIQPAQEGAWKGFTDALGGMRPAGGMQHPDKNADAATIARFGADMAAEHAKKMATLADATAKLQAVLTPEQRKTFDMMAHRAMMKRMHARFHHHGHRWHHGHRAGGDWGQHMHDNASQPAPAAK